MSRIGKLPIAVPSSVNVSIDGTEVTIKGARGELSLVMPPAIDAALQEGRLLVTRRDESRRTRSFHGLARSLMANMIEGVSNGFRKDLEIEGVGFKAALEGDKLVLSLGFSGPVAYVPPAGVKLTVDGGTKIAVTGPNKQKVGEAAARIRAFFAAEPYKGKGLRYKGERVRRKVGKTVA